MSPGPTGITFLLRSNHRKQALSLALRVNDGPCVIGVANGQMVSIPLFTLAEHLGIEPTPIAEGWLAGWAPRQPE